MKTYISSIVQLQLIQLGLPSTLIDNVMIYQAKTYCKIMDFDFDILQTWSCQMNISVNIIKDDYRVTIGSLIKPGYGNDNVLQYNAIAIPKNYNPIYPPLINCANLHYRVRKDGTKSPIWKPKKVIYSEALKKLMLSEFLT